MKKSLRELCTAIAICFCATGNLFASDNQINTDHTMDKNLNLIKEWDKVFPQSDKVSHSKVTFRNRYGITLAADMYKPKHADGKLPAIAISGPFGAVKEQSSGLYAQELAERGFLTIAFDPSYTGESGGEPRYVASPDINTEDFCAAVDFLSTRDDVDAEHIGILGICGWGGMALNAAAIDTRIKATVTSTMYDMSRVNANGYFDAMDADARYELRKQHKERLIRPCGRFARYVTRRCAPILERLLRLLQDEAWLPQAFAQLEWRMEQDLGFIVHQYAYTLV